jgi:hypothetical protein
LTPAPGQDSALHEIVTALRATAGAVTSSSALTAEREPAEPKFTGLVPHCALCQLAHRSAERSLRAFFTEFVNDPEVRVRFRKTRGFCREHVPLLSQSGDALGVAILYADLADETRNRWRSGIWSQKNNLFSRWFLGSDEPACPACTTEAEAEVRFAAALAAGLRQDEGIWEVLQASSGLCVRHVEQVAAAAAPADAARLIDLELRKMDALIAELEEFVRKNDYRFRDEPWGLERDAWRRALLRLRRP